VREMADAGDEFGSHTVNHPILSTLDSVEVEREVKESQERIAAELKRPCHLFAYPNGSAADFTDRDKQALRSAGYQAAFSLRGRLNGSRPDLFEIDRVNVGRQLDTVMFDAAAVGMLGLARRARQRVVEARRGPALATARAR
jgi:peptidoglycan/xylan/chitin deacetylase (PgdA/CDA1 family)